MLRKARAQRQNQIRRYYPKRALYISAYIHMLVYFYTHLRICMHILRIGIHTYALHILVYTHVLFPSFWSDLLIISVPLENEFYVNHTVLKAFQWQIIFYHWGFRSHCRAQCHLHIHISDLSRHPDSSCDHMDFHSRPWETRSMAITESRGN